MSELAAMATRLIVGCGYLGYRVARRWLASGDIVYAVTRHPDRAAAWRREGLQPLVSDVTHRDTLGDLPCADTVLYAVGQAAERSQAPGGRRQQAGAEISVAGLNNVLDALPATFRRFVYISSTGVYGDCEGGWVDEESLCAPRREGGKACLAAEETLLAHPYGSKTVVLRLAGLYGPGRIPRSEALLSAEPIDAPPRGYLNLIHVDDASEAVLAAEKVEMPLPRRYLIADGSPVVRAEYYAELARLLGAPSPRFREPQGETPAAARAAADKRISNARMLAELKIRLRFPSYREGLHAIVAERPRD